MTTKTKKLNNIFQDIQSDDDGGFPYVATPTGIQFHECDGFLKGIEGPFGSGKSCTVVNDILIYAAAQRPHTDGIRYTRWGVVRGTYPELISTTRNSILEVFPKGCGSINVGGAPLMGVFQFPLGDGPYDWQVERRAWKPGDGTFVQVEFRLHALQDPWDKEKVKSANWTGAWINEATGVDAEIIEAIAGRVGRYPTEALGGCSYAGILMDFNKPPMGHYLHDWMNNPRPGWHFFKQPPAVFKHEDEFGNVEYEVNPDAENLDNLSGGVEYYKNQITFYQANNAEHRIDSLFCMLDVPSRDGKPVWPTFSADIHIAKQTIDPVAFSPVIIGYDTSGVHPAVAFFQEFQGKWALLDELYGEGMGLRDFVEQALIPLLNYKYPNVRRIISCDPANAKDSYTGIAPTTHLKEHGFEVYTPTTNSPKTRILCVEHMLNKNFGGLIISPHCELSISAMDGGYRYKKLRIAGSIKAAYDSKPEKNEHSHIADAIQYAAMYINKSETSNTDNNSVLAMNLAKRRHALRRRIV